jgi:hypothetical protein
MSSAELDRQFAKLLAPLGREERAPSSLKARLYSALIHEEQQTGPLASLDASVEAGHGICVFERLVQIAPVGQQAKTWFFCQVCHARLLAEHSDNPLIFWSHCPYVKFKAS